jgi:hypothetical protein
MSNVFLRAQPTTTLKIASAPEGVLRTIFIAAFEVWWDSTLYNRWEALPAHASLALSHVCTS